MNAHKYSFKKDRKIKSRKNINSIFEKGEHVLVSPFHIRGMRKSSENALPRIQYIFSVSKKKIRKAVERNRIKRQMREICRLLTQDWDTLISEPNTTIQVVVVYTGKEKISFALAKKKLNSGIVRLINKLMLTSG
ncbi:MAG: ribonuclease P protein component [Cytophagaceae bacterium]|nr:ribonuclease P protein component [Cytophagaceae bacterium]MDW8455538.1 ribonuclease P protein component [Cytophagaceae bacterium]